MGICRGAGGWFASRPPSLCCSRAVSGPGRMEGESSQNAIETSRAAPDTTVPPWDCTMEVVGGLPRTPQRIVWNTRENSYLGGYGIELGLWVTPEFQTVGLRGPIYEAANSFFTDALIMANNQ